MNFWFRTIPLFFLFLFFFGEISELRTQNAGLDLKIKVSDQSNKGKLSNVEIVITRNGAPYQKVQTDAKGDAFVSLPLGYDYKVEFKTPGYVSKNIVIDTKNIPEEDAKYGFEFPMTVSLFEDIPDIDFSILKQPIGKLFFNPQTGYVDYDPEYTKAIQNQLNALIKAYEEKMKALAEQRKKLEAEYNAAMAAGNKSFIEKNYAEAKSHYEKASQLKPNEPLPKQKIKEIEDILKQMADKEKAYNDLIKEGDQLAQAEKYAEAIQKYKQAQSLKPNESYPRDKIAEIENLLANKEKIEKQYAALITVADNQFKAKDYQNARSNYLEASKLKPTETYPKTKMEEIDKLLADLTAKENEYKKYIAEGDNLYKSAKYESAIEQYKNALSIKPSESYPQQQIQLAQKILAEQKEKESKYTSLITQADAKFNEKNYIVAKGLYTEALKIKPSETYPAEKIKEIDKLLADSEELERKYKEALQQGDMAFSVKNYEKAKTEYEKATQLKPQEGYPRQQLEKINSILAEQNKRNEEYNKMIAMADEAMKQENYSEAKKYYEEALKVKEEQYPKDRLLEIDKIQKQKLAQELEKKKSDEQYQKIIAQADLYMGQKSYEAARLKYEEASKLKPEEEYPKNKIKEINELLAQIAKEQEEIKIKAEKEKQQKAEYEALIGSGDNKIKTGDYLGAKNDFEKALEIFPKENYPQMRLKYIEEQLAKKAKEDSLAAQAERKKQEYYEALISKADADFQSGNYEKAKENYNMALMVKPTEEYPKQKLKEIEKKLLEKSLAIEKEKQEEQLKAQKEKEYKELMAKGEKMITIKEYEEAIANFTKAAELKPEESLPKERIQYVKDLLAQIEKEQMQQKEKQEKYFSLIKQADASFDAKQYSQALELYQQASDLMPKEIYPVQRINEIKSILNTLAMEQKKNAEDSIRMITLRTKYDTIVKQADHLFEAGNYEKSRKLYQQALSVLPQEEYPKNRIKEIDVRIAMRQKQLADSLENARKQEKYEAVIRLADMAYNQKLYDNALSKYEEALAIKPEEPYPQKRINLIRQLKEQMAENANETDENQIRVSVTKDKENELDKLFSELWNTREKSKIEELEKQIADLYQNYEQRVKESHKKTTDRYADIQKMEKQMNEKSQNLNQLHKKNAEQMLEFERYLENVHQQREKRYYDNVQVNYQQQQMLADAFEQLVKEKQEESKKKDIAFYQQVENQEVVRNQWRDNAEGVRAANEQRIRELEMWRNQMMQQGYEQHQNKTDAFYEKVQQWDLNYQQYIARAEEERMMNIEKIKQLEAALQMLDQQKRSMDILKWEKAKSFEDQWTARQQEYMKGALQRIEENHSRLSDQQEKIMIQAQRGEQIHQKNIQNMQLFEQAIAQQNKERESVYARKQQQAYEDLSEKMKGWERAYQERAEMFMYRNVSNVQKYENALMQEYQQYVQKHNSRREQYYRDILQIAEQMEQKNIVRQKEYAEKLMEMEKKREEYESFQADLASLAYEKIKSYKTEYYRGEKRPRQTELSGKYPQGVTEEVIQTEQATILRRIVTNGTNVDVYEKTYYKWGGVFYTKNGQHITQALWDTETLK